MTLVLVLLYQVCDLVVVLTALPKGRSTFKMEDLTPRNSPATPLCLSTCRTEDAAVEYCTHSRDNTKGKTKDNEKKSKIQRYSGPSVVLVHTCASQQYQQYRH